MNYLSVISQGKTALANAASWFLSSDIRPSCGFASSRRLLLYGIYHSALNRNRLAFMVTTESEAMAELTRRRPGLLVVTPKLEHGDGLALVQRARSVVEDIRMIVICDQDCDDLVAAGDSCADGVFCEQELFTDAEPLRKLVISLALGRRYRSPAVLAALRSSRQAQADSWRDGAPPLTSREADLIDLWVEGLGDREVADRLGVSYTTVRSYGRSLRKKLGVGSRGQAVLKAISLGLSRVAVR
ncbi:MAG: hypothetical protein RLZZ124_72 [Cyanobacteriota bacterium]|jgi:DNA-binding NarL/FixJ family response regulator